MEPTVAIEGSPSQPVTAAMSPEEHGDLILRADAAAVQLPRYFRIKPWIDRGLALILLLPGLPIMALLIVAIRLTSRGPAIFRQRRVGLHGKTFTMYKLRSMVTDAEARTGPVWSVGKDPRVTRLGGLLRKLHLDELPQLFNVIRGEMALTGPRPERPEIAVHLATRIPGYGRRLAVLPGITGLAQINLPPDSQLSDVQRKLVVDLEYIQEACLLLDLRMTLCSLLRLLGLSGDMAISIMGLRRTPEIPAAWLEQDQEADNTSPMWWIRPASPPAPIAETPPLSEPCQADSWPALRATP
jgi:lipopolysaccharide/colanic/teichoic acid biosynthesis glycosyltransferase